MRALTMMDAQRMTMVGVEAAAWTPRPSTFFKLLFRACPLCCDSEGRSSPGVIRRASVDP